MMFRTHRAFIILLCLIVFFNPYGLFNGLGMFSSIFSNGFLWFLIVAMLASMVPDIDNPSSKLGKNVKIFGYVFLHRGFFHSLPALVLFTFIVWKLVPICAFAFFLGYISHLMLDNMNYQGIYWLYPLKYRIKGFTRSNGLFEKFLFYGLVLACLLGIVYAV